MEKILSKTKIQQDKLQACNYMSDVKELKYLDPSSLGNCNILLSLVLVPSLFAALPGR